MNVVSCGIDPACYYSNCERGELGAEDSGARPERFLRVCFSPLIYGAGVTSTGPELLREHHAGRGSTIPQCQSKEPRNGSGSGRGRGSSIELVGSPFPCTVCSASRAREV